VFDSETVVEALAAERAVSRRCTRFAEIPRSGHAPEGQTFAAPLAKPACHVVRALAERRVTHESAAGRRAMIRRAFARARTGLEQRLGSLRAGLAPAGGAARHTALARRTTHALVAGSGADLAGPEISAHAGFTVDVAGARLAVFFATIVGDTVAVLIERVTAQLRLRGADADDAERGGEKLIDSRISHRRGVRDADVAKARRARTTGGARHAHELARRAEEKGAARIAAARSFAGGLDDAGRRAEAAHAIDRRELHAGSIAAER